MSPLLDIPHRYITSRKNLHQENGLKHAFNEVRRQTGGDEEVKRDGQAVTEVVTHLTMDWFQVDRLDVRLLPGAVIKSFTARDMISGWDVIEAFRSTFTSNAHRFLDTRIECSPCPVKAIRADGGNKFQTEFEQACQ
jgi:hypothetical protein